MKKPVKALIIIGAAALSDKQAGWRKKSQSACFLHQDSRKGSCHSGKRQLTGYEDGIRIQRRSV